MTRLRTIILYQVPLGRLLLGFEDRHGTTRATSRLTKPRDAFELLPVSDSASKGAPQTAVLASKEPPASVREVPG